MGTQSVSKSNEALKVVFCYTYEKVRKRLTGKESFHSTMMEIITTHVILNNERFDVYNFGVILWELCTLQQPCKEFNNLAIMRTVMPTSAHAIVMNSNYERAMESQKEMLQGLSAAVIKAYNMLPNLDLLIPYVMTKGANKE
nr:DNA ligase 6 [Tanacetum cinerariifolium]